MLHKLRERLAKRQERNRAKEIVKVIEGATAIINRNQTCSYGLCQILSMIGDTNRYTSYVLRQEIMEPVAQWEHYSGCDVFPVPHIYGAKCDKKACEAFGSEAYAFNKWDKQTEYGRLRWDMYYFLLDYWKKKAGIK